MRACFVEACDDKDAGSIGAYYVATHARRAGHQIDFSRTTQNGYDVELISVHHCMDFLRLAHLPKRAPLRIVGGHAMLSNPRPVIPFADIVFRGEAESWIGGALDALDGEKDAACLQGVPGVIVTKNWIKGAHLPDVVFERPLPSNPPYLNWAGTKSAAWYLEIARGCPFRCAFCELGNSTPFRIYPKEHVFEALKGLDTTLARKINLFAPDETSHPAYTEIYEHLERKGYSAAFSSMRIESVMKRHPKLKPNVLIRVGIDGLSERVRTEVNKPITDDQIVEYFKEWTERGHVNFKTFFIFSYPGETEADFRGFEILMRRVFQIRLRKNCSLRIKWTPFIPQPCTPLGSSLPRYNRDIAARIRRWHALHKEPVRTPGWWVTCDGMMSEKAHALQCRLTHGDEETLIDARP